MGLPLRSVDEDWEGREMKCLPKKGGNMKRIVFGFLLGAILATSANTWAGFFYNPGQLMLERGTACGESTLLGYVAGVHDVMAAGYPPTSHSLGVIVTAARERLMTIQPAVGENYPAAWWVVGTLKDKGLITDQDIARAFPTSWRR